MLNQRATQLVKPIYEQKCVCVLTAAPCLLRLGRLFEKVGETRDRAGTYRGRETVCRYRRGVYIQRGISRAGARRTSNPVLICPGAHATAGCLNNTHAGLIIKMSTTKYGNF